MHVDSALKTVIAAVGAALALAAPASADEAQPAAAPAAQAAPESASPAASSDQAQLTAASQTAQAPAALEAVQAPQASEAPAVEAAQGTQLDSAGAASADEQYFIDLDEQVAEARVLSASKQFEPLSETPVPVTVITADMIKAIGARTLNDVLLAYVPGFTFIQDHNETYSGVRGVYGSSQQKVLVMLDGHRLNSRVYSCANFDGGISLDRVKQIEVLRGPGSSLYGNVALTAVVNIISVEGKEVDGISARAGVGNYGARTGSVLYGTEIGKSTDVLVWGSAYGADGQTVAIPADENMSRVPGAGTAIVGGVRDPFSYDAGLKVRSGGWSLLANRTLGKSTEPFTAAGVTGETYDYDAYHTYETMGPGLASRSNHLEVKYERSLSESFDVEASVYYDSNELRAVATSDPSTVSATFLDWDDDDYGLIAQGRYQYDAGVVGAGNFTLGTQLELMRMLDSANPRAVGGIWSNIGGTSPDVAFVEPGQESIYSGFAQLKHRFAENVVVNLGARLDEKVRHREPNKVLSDVSPRAAIIYSPSKILDLKLSYSQSFVDAPYFYRYNTMPSYRGADTLTPEHLRAVQLTPTLSLLDGKLRNTLNFYYERLTDFIRRNNNAAANEPLYQNAGMLKSIGAEEELAFLRRFYRVRANFTWQRPIDSSEFGASGGKIDNVPSYTGNLILDVNPLLTYSEKLWLNASVRYIGERRSPITSRFLAADGTVIADYSDPNHVEGDVWLVNLGLRFNDIANTGISLDATIWNLLDTEWYQGGSVVHPYPQTGRWFMVGLGYQFDT